MSDPEALEAALVAADTAPGILDALARACWHNDHDGPDCPNDAIPGERDVCKWFDDCADPGAECREQHERWKKARESEGGLKHPLASRVREWQATRPREIDDVHVIAPATMRGAAQFEPRPLVRAPAQLGFLGRPLDETEIETIEVDGAPFVSRRPDGFERKVYRTASKGQGELLPGPRSLSGEHIEDVLIATLADAPLTGDERATIRNDVHKLALVTYALTGSVTITESQGAVFIGGRDTEANRRRWNAAVATARALLMVINKRTLEPRDLLAASFHEGGVDIGPPAWWVKDAGAWRLTGGLFRPVLGAADGRGTDPGYWGGLHRTVNGLEAALTWGLTAGRGKGGRIPDSLRPECRGGPGAENFIPWWKVLQLGGEPVTADTPSKGPAVKRYSRRIEGLIDAGYGIPLVASGNPTSRPATAGDTIELRRIKGRRGHKAGIMVRATARFVEAYRRGQGRQDWERLPARRLFPR